MLVILLSVFTLCWLPFQIAIIYGEYRPNKHEPVSSLCPIAPNAKRIKQVSLSLTSLSDNVKEKG